MRREGGYAVHHNKTVLTMFGKRLKIAELVIKQAVYSRKLFFSKKFRYFFAIFLQKTIFAQQNLWYNYNTQEIMCKTHWYFAQNSNGVIVHARYEWVDTR